MENNKINKAAVLADRMVILQAFSEYYLRFYKGKSFSEMYPDVKDEYGHLNKEQEKILHDYLLNVYKTYGLDLNKILEEKNEVVKDGNILTDFEMSELLRLADEQLLLGGIIIDRKNKLYKNKNVK